MKKFISALLCVSSFSFASMIGLEAMGQEQIAGESKIGRASCRERV